MSATDELRKLLDEHGVEYKSHYLNTSWYAGMKLYMATDDMDGTLTVDNLTPEQAVAATLGSGTLTAAQVRECVEDLYWEGYNDGYIHRGHGIEETDWQAITDELNSRAERTCEFNIKDNMNETEGMGDVWIECSACHCAFDYFADDWLMKMSYCPNCGCKVVNA